MSDDVQEPAPAPPGSRLPWRRLAGVVVLLLVLGLAAWLLSQPRDGPPDDLWAPATARFDPDCVAECPVVLTERPTGHGGSGDATMTMRTDPRLDDAVAQWGDCLDSVFACLREDLADTPEARADQIRACVAASTCPQACRDRYAARSGGDIEAAAAAFDSLFLEEDGWCAPRD